jgi:probable rRNA maturation factor
MGVAVNNRIRSKIDTALIKKVGEIFLRRHGLAGKELSVALIGDRRMRGLNRDYRGKDKTTDILSFAADREELEKEDYFGELVINYAQIKRQSRHFSKSAREELVFIFVHGLFHLLGHEDDSAGGREEMDRLTKQFIAKNKKLWSK